MNVGNAARTPTKHVLKHGQNNEIGEAPPCLRLTCCASSSTLGCGIQAVHGGSDLRSAAANVLGFQQETVKGKPVTVESVPNVATQSLRRLLDLCTSQQRSSSLVSIWLGSAAP